MQVNTHVRRTQRKKGFSCLDLNERIKLILIQKLDVKEMTDIAAAKLPLKIEQSSNKKCL
jgi:hypothetical protein